MARVALLLAACTHDDFVDATTPVHFGEWRIEHRIDRVTGAPLSSSILVTNRVSYATMLFPPPAVMQLLCFKEHAAAMFSFDFKIGSTRNAEVAYRFDDKPGHEPYARIVDDHKKVLIDDPGEIAQFVGELATSNVLYLRIRALTAPRTSAEFKVAGAGPAIAAAYASCPPNAAAKISALPPGVRAEEENHDD